jgi:DNA primase
MPNRSTCNIKELKMKTESINIILHRALGRLKPTGNGYAMTTCPFHVDKTPSLSVTLATGSFRCFGCGTRGDLATLLAKTDRLPMHTAITLARTVRAEARHAA